MNDVLGQFVESNENGKCSLGQAETNLCRIGRLAQLRLAQRKGDPPQERALARPGVAHNHQPVVSQGVVQRNGVAFGNRWRGARLRASSPPAVAFSIVFAAIGQLRGGQRNEQVLDGESVRLPFAHLEPPDVDVG